MARCCIEGCVDVPAKDITYFNFPASRALRREWASALGVQPKTGWLVCSRHFGSGDCQRARGRTRLRPGAVPSRTHQKMQNNEDSASASSDDTAAEEAPSNSETEDAATDKEDDDKKNAITDVKEDALETKPDDKVITNDVKNCELQSKRQNLHNKLRSLHEKNKELLSKIEQLQNKNDLEGETEGSRKESSDLQTKSEELEKESENLEKIIDSLQSESGLKDGGKGVKEGDAGEKGGEASKKGGEASKKEVGGGDKFGESAVADSDRQPEDIEELLTNYHILQDRPLNIHTVTDEPAAEQGPVFIEISVDKDKTGVGDKGDCLMVIESVQVELDPSELMLPEREDMETEDAPPAAPSKEDPISLLTSSDEDDVIIEEPHIDTVEVSDETDEDDVPLVKLLKRRRAEKRLRGQEIAAARVEDAEIVPDGEADLAKILWGMYEYYCVQCHFTTSSGTEYRRHTASHAKVLMMCQICGYMTASETQFTKHEKQHGEKKYKCHLCSYKAKHNMSLLYHLKGHKAEDFVKNADMAMMKRAQVNGKVFECRLCAYTTKKRCDLQRHVSRRHKSNDDEDFVP